MKSLILLVLFVSFLSWGDNSASISESKLLGDSASIQELLSDTPAENSFLNSGSMLSLKGGASAFFIPPILGLPISLEYQGSWKEEEKLKILLDIGIMPFFILTENVETEVGIPIQAGLRYVFQSKKILSFKAGVNAVFQRDGVDPVLIPTLGFSFGGYGFKKNWHGEVGGGVYLFPVFDVKFPVFYVGCTFSYQLKKW